MTDTMMNNSNGNEELLHKLLREYTFSSDNDEIVNDLPDQELLCDYFKMVAISDTTLNENFNDNSYYDDGRISLAYENLKYIPRKIAEKFASQTKFLDLSYNNFTNLSFLAFFKRLHTLILDHNTNLDETTFPYLPKLEILWMNNCNITNILKWIYIIKSNCPVLRYLSIMGNPGARTLYNGATISEHNDYRSFIISILPNLTHLDDTPVPPRSAITSCNNELFTTSQSLRSLPSYSPNSCNIRSRRKAGSAYLRSDIQNNENRYERINRIKRPHSYYLSSSTT